MAAEPVSRLKNMGMHLFLHALYGWVRLAQMLNNLKRFMDFIDCVGYQRRLTFSFLSGFYCSHSS